MPNNFMLSIMKDSWVNWFIFFKRFNFSFQLLSLNPFFYTFVMMICWLIDSAMYWIYSFAMNS